MFEPEGSVSQTALLDYFNELPTYEEPEQLFGDIDWVIAEESEEIAVREAFRERQALGITDIRSAIEDAWKELGRRSDVIEAYYPFTIDAETASVNGTPRCVYGFLSLLGARLLYQIGRERLPTGEPSRLFEVVVRAALKNYSNGRSERFAWPQTDSGGSNTFLKAVGVLAKSMTEEEGKQRTVPPQAKDHKLDVVAWKPFNDSMPSQEVLLCQCTIGQAWDSKYVNVDIWNDVIQFVARPRNAVAFPQQLSSLPSAKVHYAAMQGGVLFDRTRIAAFAPDTAVSAAVLQQLCAWNRRAISALPSDNVRGSIRRGARLKKPTMARVRQKRATLTPTKRSVAKKAAAKRH